MISEAHVPGATRTPSGALAADGLERGLPGGFPAPDPAAAGQALYGLRYPLLSQRLPAGEPDPRMERPGLLRPLARGYRPACRDQHLPEVHRAAVPGAV